MVFGFSTHARREKRAPGGKTRAMQEEARGMLENDTHSKGTRRISLEVSGGQKRGRKNYEKRCRSGALDVPRRTQGNSVGLGTTQEAAEALAFTGAGLFERKRALEQRQRRCRRRRRPDHWSVHRLGRSLEIPGGIRRSLAGEVVVRRLGFFRRSPGNGLPHSFVMRLAVLGGIRKAPGLPTLLGALELRLAVARGPGPLVASWKPGHFASPSLGPRTGV